MKAVVQRVKHASVTADGYFESIDHGFLIFLGIHVDDQDTDYAYILKKIQKLRIFDDKEGKMNLSIDSVNGEILLISQFTLLGSVKGSNRPSFTRSAKPELAMYYYEKLFNDLNQTVKTKKGLFGKQMDIALINDGPVTILIDSKE